MTIKKRRNKCSHCKRNYLHVVKTELYCERSVHIQSDMFGDTVELVACVHVYYLECELCHDEDMVIEKTYVSVPLSNLEKIEND